MTLASAWKSSPDLAACEEQELSYFDPLWADPSVPADAIVEPCQELKGSIVAQPAKNYTTRYLYAAGLAGGKRTVEGIATSDDSRAMVHVLRCLGAEVDIEDVLDQSGRPRLRRAHVRGFDGQPQFQPHLTQDGTICVGNAGAVLRLALGAGALASDVTFTTDHPQSLGKRPNRELLEALTQLGFTVESGPDGKLPIRLQSARPSTSAPIHINIPGNRSSQFLSSLLFLSPLLGAPVTIQVTGGSLVSQPAVLQTLEVLQLSGVVVEAASDLLSYKVEPGRYNPPSILTVNGDWPGSSAILAAAAILPSDIQLHGLYADAQGERASQQVLSAYGASLHPLVSYSPRFRQTGLVVQGGGELQGLDFDGDPLTDAVLAMLAPACFAKGTTRIHNVHNLRLKECDRITEPLQELRALGVRCHEGHEVGDTDPDAILIYGNPDGYEGGVSVSGRGDHRVIMLLTLVGLRTKKGLRITGAHHVAKSYPGFFRDLASLGAPVRFVPAHNSPFSHAHNKETPSE
jgi:3-phosphoshikimate 1-carboxyvinyltransferase